jgi:hypothetical protein
MIQRLDNRKIHGHGVTARKPRLRLRKHQDDPEYSPDRHEAKAALDAVARFTGSISNK